MNIKTLGDDTLCLAMLENDLSKGKCAFSLTEVFYGTSYNEHTYGSTDHSILRKDAQKDSLLPASL